MSWQLIVFSGRKLGQYADQELLKYLFKNKTPNLVLKKKRKKKDTETRKQRRRKSNMVHLHLQETSWPLHHSDANDVKN